jgi:hypothetical protein
MLILRDLAARRGPDLQGSGGNQKWKLESGGPRCFCKIVTGKELTGGGYTKV